MNQTSLVAIDTKTYLHSLTSTDPFLFSEPRTFDHQARSNGGTVGLLEILAQIDRTIRQLKQARAFWESRHLARTSRKSPRSRNLTPQGRRRIAEAVKRRWALQQETPILKAAGARVAENRPATHLACQPPQL
jgi:hypothetical protein